MAEDAEEDSRLAAHPACYIESVKCPVRPLVRCGAHVAPLVLTTRPRTAAGNPARSPSPRHTHKTSTRQASGTEQPRLAVTLTPGRGLVPKTKAFRRLRAHTGAQPAPATALMGGTGGARPAALTFPATPRGNKAPPDLQGRAEGGRSAEGHPPPPASPPPARPPPRPAAAAPGTPGPAPAATVSRDGGPGLFPALPAWPPAPGPAGRPSTPLPGQALASATHASCGSGGGTGFARSARSWDCAAAAINNVAFHWPSLLAPPSASKTGCDWTDSAQVHYASAPRSDPRAVCK